MLEMEMDMDINLLRDCMEYGCGYICPYEVYAAIEYSCIED